MRLTGLWGSRAAQGVVSGLAVALLATACGGAEEPEPERVTAEQQCDGTLSPQAARALETVLRTKQFSAAGSGGLDRITKELDEDYPKLPLWTQGRSLCRPSRPGNHDSIQIELRLRRDDDALSDRRVTNLHPYDLGREALSGPELAHLVVNCVSPRFQGSDKRPALIQGTLSFLRSKLPDTAQVREANLTILHSATLAVVRKLGCENDAGLTEKPVFTPLPE